MSFADVNPDLKRVNSACIMSGTREYIESLPESYNTQIPWNGSFLSGGQPQRFAIARALYKSSNVTFLEEFISALEHKTDNKVLEAITSLPQSTTVFLIAHREARLEVAT